MKKITNILIFLIYLSTLVYAEEGLQIITSDSPPLSFVKNNIAAGPAVDMANEIQNILKTSEAIKVFPWARAFKMLQEESNTVLFSTTRTEQRELMFKWVGPIVEKRFVFIAKKASGIKINNLNDAKKYSIGVIRGSNNEDYLLENGFKDQIENVTNESQNALKLFAKRMDLWYTSNATAAAQMENLSFKTEDFVEVFTTQESQSYFAFNMNTPDSTVSAWQKSLDILYKEGTVLNILKKYKIESLYAK